MNTATKEAYKGLAGSVWEVIKSVLCVVALLLAGYFAAAGDYDKATFNMVLTLLLRD